MTPKPRPPWCGSCDESTRLVELPGGTVARCATCHPLATRITLLEQLEAARAEVARLEAALAAEPVAEWVRGPGVRP